MVENLPRFAGKLSFLSKKTWVSNGFYLDWNCICFFPRKQLEISCLENTWDIWSVSWSVRLHWAPLRPKVIHVVSWSLLWGGSPPNSPGLQHLGTWFSPWNRRKLMVSPPFSKTPISVVMRVCQCQCQAWAISGSSHVFRSLGAAAPAVDGDRSSPCDRHSTKIRMPRIG